MVNPQNLPGSMRLRERGRDRDTGNNLLNAVERFGVYVSTVLSRQGVAGRAVVEENIGRISSMVSFFSSFSPPQFFFPSLSVTFLHRFLSI